MMGGGKAPFTSQLPGANGGWSLSGLVEVNPVKVEEEA